MGQERRGRARGRRAVRGHDARVARRAPGEARTARAARRHRGAPQNENR